MSLRGLFRVLRWMVASLLFLAVAGYLVLTYLPSFGAGSKPQRSSKLIDSPQLGNEGFENSLPGSQRPAGYAIDYLKRQFGGDEVRTPPGPIPIVKISRDQLPTPPTPGLRAYWLGHSSVLIDLDGVRLMVDPIFSDFASPFDFAGPKRFHPPPIALSELPLIDIVMISHDHYDHLDMQTVQHLASKGTTFMVPLGVGAHMRRWKIPDRLINELDWGDSVPFGPVTITSTPARHYSGRGLFDGRQTLWSSWTMVGPDSRVFYSGDTGFSSHFEKIGAQYGPFDLTIIKVGAYGPGDVWTEVHMRADQAVDAHVAVRGKRMLPVHWSTFNMAFHAWDEPIELAIKAATDKNVEMVTPRIGETITAGEPFDSHAWWHAIVAPPR